MSEEKVCTFSEYVLGYDSGGDNDRSCLTISKILNDNMYVMSTLYDGSAEVISTILDSLQQKVEQLEKENNEMKEKLNIDLQWAFKCDELFARNKQLENIRKEAVDWVYKKGIKEEEWQNGFCTQATATYTRDEIFDLLNILSKGSEDK